MPSYSSSSSCASKNSLPLSAKICSTKSFFFCVECSICEAKKKEKKRSILLADEGDGDIAKRFVERVAFALAKIFWL